MHDVLSSNPTSDANLVPPLDLQNFASTKSFSVIIIAIFKTRLGTCIKEVESITQGCSGNLNHKVWLVMEKTEIKNERPINRWIT